jgi:hypothetical protein
MMVIFSFFKTSGQTKVNDDNNLNMEGVEATHTSLLAVSYTVSIASNSN